MAGEIFVGSVSVGVVPDLRGFNDRMRVELVPAANRIGQDIGREMSRGIMEGLDIGRIVSESTTKAKVVARKSGYDLGMSYGRAFRRGFELALEGWKPKVTVQVDADTLAARAAIDRLGGTVTERVRTTGGGTRAAESVIERVISGGSGRGGGGGIGDGGPGFIGGISALLKSLPGGTSGSIAAVPASIGVPAAIAGAAALPFIGQILAGTVPAVLGGGLAAMGIGGALGLPGQMGAQQVAQLHDKVAAGQDRVAASQARLNKLQQSGKASAAQLQAAQATLASQQASLAVAQNKYEAARKNQLTGSQLQVRNAFENIGINAKQSLAEIGASFVPVMLSIASTAQSAMDKLTPVFSSAVKTISGPFKVFSDTLITAFTSPQVSSSIQAVANAFADVMKAFTPDIPGIVNSFADAIERIAHAVSDNPKAFADFLNFLFQVGIVILNGIAFLADFANYVEQHFLPAVHHFVNFWLQVGHDIEHVWDVTWNAVSSITRRGIHEVAVVFDGARHEFAHVWDTIYDNTIGKLVRLFNGIKNFFARSFDNWWKTHGDALEKAWSGVWQRMVDIVKTIFGPVIYVIAAFIDVIEKTFRGSSKRVEEYWHNLWTRTVAIVKGVVGPIITIVKGIWTAIVNQFKIDAKVIAAIWSSIWETAVNVLKAFWASIKAIVKAGWDVIVGIFSIFLDIITGHWRTAWNDLKRMAIQVWNNMKDAWRATFDAFINIFKSWFHTLKTTVISAFDSAINWLVNAGKAIIQGLLQGIKNAMTGIGNWIKHTVVEPLINAVKNFFGIHSPATMMMPVGTNLIMGIIHGMITGAKDLGKFVGKIFGGWPEALAHFIEKSFISISRLPGKALKALGGVAGHIGGFFANVFHGGPAGAGVERWLNIVKVALMLNNLPDSLAGQVLYQMRTESGGDPNAINNWDINAQRGDPSRGLMQTIGSTFAAYHIPGTSMNIYDPLANVAAAINYAKHVYGPSLMRGGMGLGSGHGYDQGGWLPTGASIAYNLTGKPELVLTHEQMQGLARGGDGGTQYIAHFDSLTGASIESHVRTAFQAMSMTQGNLNRQGRRR